MDGAAFDPDLIQSIFKLVWSRRSEKKEEEREIEIVDPKVNTGTTKKNRPTSANLSALKVSCELLRLFVTEAVERAAIVAETEGSTKVEATHLERILPQLLLDF